MTGYLQRSLVPLFIQRDRSVIYEVMEYGALMMIVIVHLVRKSLMYTRHRC